MGCAGLKTSQKPVESMPEFKYYGYYKAVRKKIEESWHKQVHARAPELRARKTVPGAEWKSGVIFDVNSDGILQNIKLAKSSSVPIVDDVAVQSLKAAKTVPAPPVGLLKNGIVTMHWEFVLQDPMIWESPIVN